MGGRLHTGRLWPLCAQRSYAGLVGGAAVPEEQSEGMIGAWRECVSCTVPGELTLHRDCAPRTMPTTKRVIVVTKWANWRWVNGCGSLRPPVL